MCVEEGESERDREKGKNLWKSEMNSATMIMEQVASKKRRKRTQCYQSFAAHSKA